MNIPIPSAIAPPASLGTVPAIPLPSGGGGGAMMPPQSPPANPYGAPPVAPVSPGLANQAPPMTGSPYGQLSPTAPYGENAFGLHPDVDAHKLVDQLLGSVRNVESTNNYKAFIKPNPNIKIPKTASGAYGYTDPTWAKYKGFARALDAPPEVQDERMREDLLHSLKRYGGDPFKTIAHHYYPAYAGDLSKWDQKPVDRYGKEIQGAETLKSYVGKVIGHERVDAYLKHHRG